MAAALLRLSRGPRSCFFFSSAKPAVLRCCTIRTSARLDLNGCKVSDGCELPSVAGDITDEDSDDISARWDRLNDFISKTRSKAASNSPLRAAQNYAARHFSVEIEEINQVCKGLYIAFPNLPVF